MAERSHSGCTNHLPVGGSSVAPNQFHEFERKGPFHVGRIDAVWTRAFDTPVAEQDLARCHEEVARLQGAANRV